MKQAIKYICNRYFLPGLLGLILLLASCAQMVNPSGGIKDSTPPLLVKSIPANKSVNIKPQNIYLEFDEYLDVKDANGQLIVSPVLKYTPDIKTKKRSLTVELKDTLKENTTYTFNFGNSIRDFTEGNITDGFSYVFSTGSFLDSLTFSGTVKNSFTCEPQKAVSILMYDTHSDSVVIKDKPAYITKTTDNGTFQINNIKEGSYKIVALKDANNNLTYNPEEEIGFLNDTIHIHNKVNKCDLTTFSAIPEKLKIKKSRAVEYAHLFIEFNKDGSAAQLKKLNVSTLESLEKMANLEWSTKKDSLHIWLNDTLAKTDSLSLFISDSQSLSDTLFFKLPKPMAEVKSTGRGIQQIPVRVSLTEAAKQDISKPFFVTTSYPIEIFDTSKFFIQTLANKKITVTVLPDTARPLKKLLIKPQGLVIDSNYTFIILPNAITGKNKLKNTDTIQTKFLGIGPEYYGTVQLKFKNNFANSTNYILELISVGGSVVSTNYITELTSQSFKSVLPGKYRIRLIADSNKNNEWDTGNYFKHIQPEGVYYYPQEITVRSNWDMELEWVK